VPEEKITIIAKYRLEQARECLNDALLSINAGSYKNAANRSYYCIFHSMRAVLALEKFDSKKHSGIIDEFRLKYIKTEIFPKEFSNIIRDAFTVRNKSDYDDFYLISKSDVIDQTENATVFLTAVETYIRAQ